MKNLSQYITGTQTKTSNVQEVFGLLFAGAAMLVLKSTFGSSEKNEKNSKGIGASIFGPLAGFLARKGLLGKSARISQEVQDLEQSINKLKKKSELERAKNEYNNLIWGDSDSKMKTAAVVVSATSEALKNSEDSKLKEDLELLETSMYDKDGKLVDFNTAMNTYKESLIKKGIDPDKATDETNEKLQNLSEDDIKKLHEELKEKTKNLNSSKDVDKIVNELGEHVKKLRETKEDTEEKEDKEDTGTEEKEEDKSSDEYIEKKQAELADKDPESEEAKEIEKELKQIAKSRDKDEDEFIIKTDKDDKGNPRQHQVGPRGGKKYRVKTDKGWGEWMYESLKDYLLISIE